VVGTPTGWEIVLALIGRVAELTEEELPADLEVWYLARLGRTPAEREAIIKSFIEPSGDAPGRRPTAAHRGLARLAKGGFV
jgi:hypothetical protein